MALVEKAKAQAAVVLNYKGETADNMATHKTNIFRATNTKSLDMKTLANFMFKTKKKTPHDKYMIFNEFFGCAGIMLESYINATKPNFKRQYNDAIRDGHIFHPNDNNGIRNAISIMEKPFEK